jgi:hypothetical protein
MSNGSCLGVAEFVSGSKLFMSFLVEEESGNIRRILSQTGFLES